MSFNDTSDQVLSGGIDNEIKVLSIYWFPKFPWGGGGEYTIGYFLELCNAPRYTNFTCICI